MKVCPSILVAGLVLVGSLGFAQTLGQPEHFTANAISNSPQYGTGQQMVDINVNRWSTPAERDELVAALTSKGEKELLKDMQKMKSVGTIRTPDSLGYTLRYAFQTPDPDGGRTVVIATDRPIGFWEATRQPRSFDYPFTVIQMHMDPDGGGKGTMSIATKITAKNNQIELEDFATQPVMLNNIKAEPKHGTK
jgi:hypothetical protein